MYPAVGLAALCRVSAAPALPAMDSILAYWKMDEAGSVNRLDASGNGHTLAVNGTVNAVAGKINNGAEFNGIGANFLSNNDGVFSGAAPFTIFGWLSTGVAAANVVAIGHYNPGLLQGWEILQTAADRFAFRTDGNPDLVHTTPVTIGPFFLVIVTVAVGTATIRVNNGADVSAALGAFANPAVTFRVGGNNAGGSWGGVIDEVGVYNRVLSSAEKDALWNAGAGKSCCPFT